MKRLKKPGRGWEADNVTSETGFSGTEASDTEVSDTGEMERLSGVWAKTQMLDHARSESMAKLRVSKPRETTEMMSRAFFTVYLRFYP